VADQRPILGPEPAAQPEKPTVASNGRSRPCQDYRDRPLPGSMNRVAIGTQRMIFPKGQSALSCRRFVGESLCAVERGGPCRL